MTTQTPTISAMCDLNPFLDRMREKFKGNEKGMLQIEATQEMADSKGDDFWGPLVKEVEGMSQPARAQRYAKAIADEIQGK